MPDEWTFVRFRTLLADGDIRLRAGQHLLAFGHPGRDLAYQFRNFLGHVHAHEQATVVAAARVDELVVDVPQVGGAHDVACPTDYPSLDGNVVEVMRFGTGGGLDFDQMEAIVPAGEHVGAHQHPSVLEGWLEQYQIAVALK